MLLPARSEVLLFIFREPNVVENDSGAGAARNQLKPGNRVDARGPGCGAPCLDDPLIRYQFDVAAFDLSTKQLEPSAGFRINLGRQTAACCEFFGVEQQLINPFRSRFVIHVEVNRRAWFLSLRLRDPETGEHQPNTAACNFLVHTELNHGYKI